MLSPALPKRIALALPVLILLLSVAGCTLPTRWYVTNRNDFSINVWATEEGVRTAITQVPPNATVEAEVFYRPGNLVFYAYRTDTKTSIPRRGGIASNRAENQRDVIHLIATGNSMYVSDEQPEPLQQAAREARDAWLTFIGIAGCIVTLVRMVRLRK